MREAGAPCPTASRGARSCRTRCVRCCRRRTPGSRRRRGRGIRTGRRFQRVCRVTPRTVRWPTMSPPRSAWRAETVRTRNDLRMRRDVEEFRRAHPFLVAFAAHVDAARVDARLDLRALRRAIEPHAAVDRRRTCRARRTSTSRAPRIRRATAVGSSGTVVGALAPATGNAAAISSAQCRIRVRTRCIVARLGRPEGLQASPAPGVWMSPAISNHDAGRRYAAKLAGLAGREQRDEQRFDAGVVADHAVSGRVRAVRVEQTMRLRRRSLRRCAGCSACRRGVDVREYAFERLARCTDGEHSTRSRCARCDLSHAPARWSLASRRSGSPGALAVGSPGFGHWPRAHGAAG